MSISPGHTTFTINVTEDDFANGTPNDVARCAVARAVKRATGLTQVAVSPSIMDFTLTRVILPGVVCDVYSAELHRTIGAFDRGYATTPMSFDLTVPLAALAQVQA